LLEKKKKIFPVLFNFCLCFKSVFNRHKELPENENSLKIYEHVSRPEVKNNKKKKKYSGNEKNLKLFVFQKKK